MRRAIQIVAILALVTGTATAALAQTRSLEEGPVVRRQLLYRSNRLEIAPALGHTLNDPYRRTFLIDAALNYHLTNTFSLGINLGWGALNYNSNIVDEAETSNPRVERQLTYADKTILTDFHVGWVPFYGKFNLFGTTTVNYDFHILAGVGGALVSSDEPDLEGFKFGPTIGGGFRFFINGNTALLLDVVDYMYSSADVARAGEPVEESFSQHVLVTLGVSLFVTGELRVSR